MERNTQKPMVRELKNTTQRGGRNCGLGGHWLVSPVWTTVDQGAPGQEKSGGNVQTAGLGGKREKEVGTLGRNFLKEHNG